jgi:hypothetical protein
VIHIEKNVMDNILGTMLDIKGKTKDNAQQEMGLRPKLHPYTGNDGKTYLLPACHTMSNDDKIAFLEGASRCKGARRLCLEHFPMCSIERSYNVRSQES